MKKGLVLIDIQNDYFEGGKYELVNPKQAVVQVNKLLSFFRSNHMPVIHVRHISTKENATFFLPDTLGAELYNGCAPIEGEDIVIKHRPDSFLGTNLKELLNEKGIDELVICGMMTHMCIDTTVRASNFHGFAVELIEDGCATRDLEWKGNKVSAEQVQNAYMAALSGTFATVFKADDWIGENE